MLSFFPFFAVKHFPEACFSLTHLYLSAFSNFFELSFQSIVYISTLDIDFVIQEIFGLG